MSNFDAKFLTVLEAYHTRLKEEQTQMRSLPREEGIRMRDQFLLPVGIEVGHFLNYLIKAANAQTILEIGSAYGYSTLWLTEAARATGGKVISLEIDEAKARYTKEKMAQAGLIEWLDCRVRDALISIDVATESFDFVLLDIWKELYKPCFELFFPKLNKGAYIVADNMIFPPFHHLETEAYKSAIEATKAFDTILLPIGSGIEVSHFKPG